MLISQSLPDSQLPATLDAHVGDCERFFDHYSSVVDTWHTRNPGYHLAVASLAKFIVPPDVSVLEIGCGTGDLVASLFPDAPGRRCL